MLDQLERLLQSEVENESKSERTASEYLNVARKLMNGDYTDHNIPSKARWLHISAVLSYLKDYELIAPTENFGLHPKALRKRFRGGKNHNQKVKEIEEKVVTDAQFQMILAALPSTPKGQELILACELSRYSGMRASEVISLLPEQIDIKPDAVYINITGKRRKPRTVYLPLNFAPRLHLFKGFHITQNYLACTYHRITRKLGFQTSFHALRHTFATEATENGMDLRTLAALLGHEDPKTTMLYSHVKRECPQQLLTLWKKTGK